MSPARLTQPSHLAGWLAAVQEVPAPLLSACSLTLRELKLDHNRLAAFPPAIPTLRALEVVAGCLPWSSRGPTTLQAPQLWRASLTGRVLCLSVCRSNRCWG